ncbi:unnamed protein product [Aureobasidium mustum]|uniref:Uncharacterized protein n=1 Tax=Aureobasidium mustum TaxID=2773714 RepID=A0A9N8PD89_9PEZI|nr:unnamed protein product [Aureobasidium mustum]
MSPSLRSLIDSGRISNRCLRRNDHCHQEISDRNLELARRILESVEFQAIDSNQDYQYEVDLWMLAGYSFCDSCQRVYPEQVESYHRMLIRCLAEEFRAPMDSVYDSGSTSGSNRTKTEPQRLKERRSCHPNELESLAKQIKQLEHQTDGFKRRISDLKQELEDERKQHQQLKFQHIQMVGYAEAKYAEMIQFGEAKHAEMMQFGEARFAELMQKIAGLETQNLLLQQQMQNQHTIDQQDMAKMIGTIKELNAELVQCYGQQYHIWLTPTSQHVVGHCA